MPTTPRSAGLRAWHFLADQDRLIQPFDLPGGLQSLDQASACLPPGAYTTFRTYMGDRVLRLKDHIQRLELSASLTDQPVDIDEVLLRSALREAIYLYRMQDRAAASDGSDTSRTELRIRLTLSLDVTPPGIYITFERMQILPPQVYREGVLVVTTKMSRYLPEAKLTRFIERSSKVRQSLTEQVNEAVMKDEGGYLIEGISSNFFAVLAGGIQTAGRGVLPGITRTIILEKIREYGIPIAFEPLHQDQIPNLDEAFITSSSRGVLPVRQVDQHMVGAGLPGPLTNKLMLAYEQTILEQAQPI